jgi:3-oxoacyl-[acyl-carrier protein] reductase
MLLNGHIALITGAGQGAGQGIGRACAVIFAAQGADLILLDKNPETLTAISDEVAGMGRKVMHYTLDLTNLENLREAVENAHKIGLIDILVNNAGFDRPGTTAKIDKQEFEAVLGIHITVPLSSRLFFQVCVKPDGVVL